MTHFIEVPRAHREPIYLPVSVIKGFQAVPDLRELPPGTKTEILLTVSEAIYTTDSPEELLAKVHRS